MPKKRKRLQILDPSVEEQPKVDKLTLDEEKALEMYQALKSKKIKLDVAESSDEEEHGAEETKEDSGDERRGITYQIAKNKGLQPKRSKLQRNPRVKHRHKYEKAKVRRKGQVREVRKEVKKYSGEMSGINARVKKGVKLM